MSTHAYTILHYGKEWLFHSLSSIRPYVDEIFVFYTPLPSHGHSSLLACPDSKEELFQIASQFDVYWHEGTYRWEGEHRDFALRTCRDAGADVILVVDADEIWDPQHLKSVLSFVAGSKVRDWCVGMRHFWRSLNWICDDECMPLRVVILGGRGIGYLPVELGKVWHMGYAQTPRTVRYKMSIHGHKAELRHEWFSKKFLAWVPGMGDVHPTNVDFWDPKLFDKSKIQSLVGDHPYYHLDLIENAS